MDYTYTAKGCNITDAVKNRIENKLGRMSRLLPRDTALNVKITLVKSLYTIEVTAPIPKRTLRAEVKAPDLNNGIDQIVDILEKQMVKYKTRLKGRARGNVVYKEELSNYADDTQDADETPAPTIERVKKFALKPMDPEEAILELELLNHNFYMFRNSDTNDIAVVYKRSDGTYGLIEPEF